MGRGVRGGVVTVVHTVASLRAEHGGPSRSVTALASALAAHGVATRIVTTRTDQEGPPILPEAGVQVTSTPRPGLADLLRPSRSPFVRALCEPEPPAVLHDHGIWLPTNHLVSRIARQRRIPRVVSVRGMLSAWALAQGGARKRAAWHLYQRRDLASAALLHATAEAEAEDLRALGLRGPVAVIPNGVVVPPPGPERPLLAQGGRALFLARLHPGKGLLDLVQAWAEVRPQGWELVVAGPDDNGHRAEVETLARTLGVHDALRFTGEVGDDAKWMLYREADLFVLPTHSENFGITIAEALAAGTPVITTKGAPWQDLETHRCGWWTDIGVAALARALAEAVAVSDEERRAKGARGRALVEARYSWSSVAAQMAEAYAWVLNRGPRPDCLYD
jgi:glycosyltransferase involved in cell wall biosynthesis